jgi:hypothetical protein
MRDLPSLVAKARQARAIATMLADPARSALGIELMHAAVIDLLLAETDETVPPANLQMVTAALERLTRVSQTRNAVAAPDPSPSGGLSGQTIAEIKSRVLGLTLPS